MLENEIKMFSIEDLFPNSTELYENVLANNSEDDVFTRANQWQQNRDKTVVNIFRQLIILYTMLLERVRSIRILQKKILLLLQIILQILY